MRGVLATRTSAAVHDLSHDIAPFDVMEAAWFLRTVVRFWPNGTIFVAVIDPGVGSDRRIVVAEQNNQIFIAPDNGLLSFVVDPGARVHSLENEAWFLPTGSTTFHGRDRFAPAAAAIANGASLDDAGPPLHGIRRLRYERPTYEDDVARGSVVAIDRFGNLITDIERAGLRFDTFVLHVRDVIIDRIERNYAAAEPGPFLIVGSSGLIEISVANASAAERLHLRRLDRVEVWKSEE